jgi:hypothetical protein
MVSDTTSAITSGSAKASVASTLKRRGLQWQSNESSPPNVSFEQEWRDLLTEASALANVPPDAFGPSAVKTATDHFRTVFQSTYESKAALNVPCLERSQTR